MLVLGLLASATAQRSSLQQQALDLVLEDFHSRRTVQAAFKEQAVTEAIETVSISHLQWAAGHQVAVSSRGGRPRVPFTIRTSGSKYSGYNGEGSRHWLKSAPTRTTHKA